MSATDTRTQSIAATYAEAIYGLAVERKQADALMAEIAGLEALMTSDPAFAAFLTDADVDEERRAAAIEKALRGRAGDLLVDALQVINAKGRMNLLQAILAECRAAHERAMRIVEVEVTSAVPLTEDLRASLIAAAGRYTGGEVRLVETVDESLLGGLIVRVGDMKLDTSLSRHLVRMNEIMLEHGDRAIHGDSEKRFVEGMPV